MTALSKKPLPGLNDALEDNNNTVHAIDIHQNITMRNQTPSPALVSDTLFDADLLESVQMQNMSSMIELPTGLCLRPLHIDDYDKGFLLLLAQLTTVGDLDLQKFQAVFVSMQRAQRELVCVVEDIRSGRLVAAASLIIEAKFIHGGSKRGRIEDVVVHEDMRGKQLGKILLERLSALGERLGCYKMSLECKDHLLPFYAKFGYVKDPGNNFCVKRFDQK